MSDFTPMMLDNPRDELYHNCRGYLSDLLVSCVNVVNSLYMDYRGKNKFLCDLDSQTFITLQKLIPISDPRLISKNSLRETYVKEIEQNTDIDWEETESGRKPSFQEYVEQVMDDAYQRFENMLDAYKKIKARRDAELYWEE
ncbi:MAG: hypothetical protein MJY98_03640 [Fibrobacter sp.]|nr:hypothetical protein [Fibrobacter sp.]